jgi:hypothetical protein
MLEVKAGKRCRRRRVPIGTVPSPCLNNTQCIAAVIDLLPEIDRGSIVKAGLKWSLALGLAPCFLQGWRIDCCTSCSALPHLTDGPRCAGDCRSSGSQRWL